MHLFNFCDSKIIFLIFKVLSVPACTMFDSLVENKMAVMKQDPGKTICHGISAPYTGKTSLAIFNEILRKKD